MIQDPVRRHALLLALIVAIVVVLWASATLQAAFVDALYISRNLFEEHPLASRLVFIALAAFSAILMFFSSIALVPLAVNAWGAQHTLLLLMIGWFSGANLAYFIGRRFGRRVTEYFVAAETLDRYGHLLSAKMSIVEVTLLKLTLPSEMPSFALGIVRYPVPKLVPVLLASELPFALWAVYLGTALVEDRRAAFLIVLAAGFALLALTTHRMLRRR